MNDYEAGYSAGYEDGESVGRDQGHGDGYKRGYEKGKEDAADMSVSYSDGLYTASLTSDPSVFETGTSMFEALGRLTFRVGNVSKVGAVP